MSQIDAYIAQGGGIDLPGIMQNAQIAKQNDLLNLGQQAELDEFTANAPVREATRESALSAFETESIIRGAQGLKAHLDVAANAQTGQARLSAMSETLDFLDKRAENIKARGGNPSETVEAKNIIENYIANPATGHQDFVQLVQLVDNLSQVDPYTVGGRGGRGGDDKGRQLLKTYVNEQGQIVNVYRDGTHEVTGSTAQRANLKIHAVKGVDAQGNETFEVFRVDPTNWANPDGTVTQSEGMTPIQVADPQAFINSMPQGQVTYSDGKQTPSRAPVTAPQPSGNVTATVGGLAAQEAAKESAKTGAKVTEERFAKIVSDSPSNTRMAGFIGKISNNTIDSATKIKKIIKEHPTAAVGWASKFFVDNSGEKQVLKPYPGSVDDPAIQVATLLNQMFGSTAFSTLQEMRAASPTGGALGQVSNFEVDLLKTQFGAFSQESDAEFAQEQLDKITSQAKLVNDLAMSEVATYQRIQALGPDATKEQIADLVNAGFKNMASIYKRHGRDSGTWDDQTLTWSPSEKTVSGESNEGKKDALDLTPQEITSQEQYDALPSGAIYLEDGKEYRKP